MTHTIGLLLAAGAGRRMGMPKALVEGSDGVPWVVSAARTLAVGGCAETVVVIGAASAQVRLLLEAEPVTIVEATDWEAGMGSSLRAGLNAIADHRADAALVHLVDLSALAAGGHHLVFVGQTSGTVSVMAVTVVAPVVASEAAAVVAASSSSVLSSTGVDPAVPIGAAGILLLLGLGLLIVVADRRLA